MIGVFLPPMALDTSKIKYSVKFIKAFDKKEYKDKVVIFIYSHDMPLIQKHISHLPVKFFNFRIHRKVVERLKKKCKLSYAADFNTAIRKHHITFAVFPTPQDEIIDCPIPYATTFQSLGHRLNPELCETSQNGIWKSREDIYAAVCKDAKLILIDSEVGKKYLKFYYNPNANIVVIPHTIPDQLNVDVSLIQQKSILKKFGVTRQYLFYPAQLWPHKNHVRIFEAVKYLKNKGLDFQLIFTGSSRSINNQYGVDYMLRRIAQDSNMEDNLIITGYLDDEEMKTFYVNASALVMPQLIPEPCIPYVEAMRLGCPVIASDIPGIKEQINDAGVLVNPYDIESIAWGIETLLNEETRLKLIKKGIENYKSIENAANMAFSSVRDWIIKLAHG